MHLKQTEIYSVETSSKVGFFEKSNEKSCEIKTPLSLLYSKHHEPHGSVKYIQFVRAACE